MQLPGGYDAYTDLGRDWAKLHQAASALLGSDLINFLGWDETIDSALRGIRRADDRVRALLWHYKRTSREAQAFAQACGQARP